MSLLKLSHLYIKIANKLINQLLKRVHIPLIKIKVGSDTLLAAIKPREDGGVDFLGASVIADSNLPFNPEFNPSEWKRISSIYSEDPMSGTFLFMASLVFAGKLVSDSSVSPAAQDVMKRFYEKNKDTVNIVPNVLKESHVTKDKPWMTAGFTSGTVDRAPVDLAIQEGEKYKQLYSENDIIELIAGRFEYLYSKEEKTKTNKGVKIVQDPVQDKSYNDPSAPMWKSNKK